MQNHTFPRLVPQHEIIQLAVVVVITSTLETSLARRRLLVVIVRPLLNLHPTGLVEENFIFTALREIRMATRSGGAKLRVQRDRLAKQVPRLVQLRTVLAGAATAAELHSAVRGAPLEAEQVLRRIRLHPLLLFPQQVSGARLIPLAKAARQRGIAGMGLFHHHHRGG